MQKNNILSMFILLNFCLTSISATVFTPLPTDISTKEGIYNHETPNLLRVDIKSIISNGVCIEDNYVGCTLNDVNNDTNGNDDFKPEVKIHFSADDFLNDGKTSNATIRLRGQTSRSYPLKSYRIKLDSKKKLWRDERKLQLNKHIGDSTRVKNKLSFDLMSTIPHLPSLRTQFVQLYIDNQNYGLFTHVENVGKEYLKKRGFDKNSNLYKAENFEFRLRAELDIDADGQPIDEKKFESILEIKRGKDSKKLIEMLTALENPDNDFKHDVMDKYFNSNNFLTWASVNTLMGNSDVKTSNFYIFNPKGKSTFYFLPWDYDQTWGSDWEESTLSSGSIPSKTYRVPHSLWVTKLGQRFLSQPNAIHQLQKAVEEIKNNYLTKNKIEAFTNSYHDIVFPLISQKPDFDFINFDKSTDELTLETYNNIYNSLPKAIERNYQTFLKDLESPMPFWLEKPVLNEEKITFNWDKSVDLQNDKVSYELEISTTPIFKFEDIKYSKKSIEKNHFSTPWMLPKGTYYYRVTARDDKNPQENWQQAFNEFNDKDLNRRIFGVKKFTIEQDGIVPQENSSEEVSNTDSNNESNHHGKSNNSVVGGVSIFFIILMILSFHILLSIERKKNDGGDRG